MMEALSRMFEGLLRFYVPEPEGLGLLQQEPERYFEMNRVRLDDEKTVQAVIKGHYAD